MKRWFSVFSYRFSVEKNARLKQYQVCSIEYRVRERENTRKVARCELRKIQNQRIVIVQGINVSKEIQNQSAG